MSTSKVKVTGPSENNIICIPCTDGSIVLKLKMNDSTLNRLVLGAPRYNGLGLPTRKGLINELQENETNVCLQLLVAYHHVIVTYNFAKLQ